MNRAQIIATSLAAALFCGLYFGFSTKPKERERIEAKRAIEGAATDPGTILKSAETKISEAQKGEISRLAAEIEAEKSEAKKAELLKKLSGAWFQAGSPLASGIFAEKVAEIEKTDAAWSVCGATFQTALTRAADETERQFAGKKSVAAFENAVSLAPKNAEHQVNLAAVFADFPPADNPMKAVLMLRDLEKKYPSEPSVFNALGRLAIKTGQWDRAIARFEKTLELDSKNLQANCLVAEAYEKTNQSEKAKKARENCENLKK